jgi:hypothetical protein
MDLPGSLGFYENDATFQGWIQWAPFVKFAAVESREEQLMTENGNLQKALSLWKQYLQ